MLVLSLNEGERVVMGDPLNPLGYIEHRGIVKGKTRIGFSFPREVRINREEVVDRIRAGEEDRHGTDNASAGT